MRFVGHNLVTLLLTTVMAMPMLSPPALRHSHAGGDTPHSHRAEAVHSHGHSHLHGPKHSHSSRHSHRADPKAAQHLHGHRKTHSANPPVEHYHVYWFGFETWLPLSAPQRSDSSQPVSDAGQWVPLISDVRLPDRTDDGSNFVAVELGTPTRLTPRLPVRAETRPLKESAANLLCDTARRERSGVLVI